MKFLEKYNNQKIYVLNLLRKLLKYVSKEIIKLLLKQGLQGAKQNFFLLNDLIGKME